MDFYIFYYWIFIGKKVILGIVRIFILKEINSFPD
jgi:hypothetical protein